MDLKKLRRKSAAVFFGLLMSVAVFAGLETGTYISDLVATNPLSSDLASTADDHLRLIKTTVKNSFPNISGAMTATHTELNTLDGITADTAELNILDGVTSSTAELNILDGVTSTTTQLNYLNAATGTTGTGSVVYSASPTLTGTLTAGTVSATTLTGAGSGITALNASNVSSGTVADARLSSNVPLVDQDNNFSVGQSVVSGTPYLIFNESDVAADNRIWTFRAVGEQLQGRISNDASSVSTNWLQVERTGTTVDSVNFLATAVQANGSTIRSAAFDRVARMSNTATGAACTVADDEGITSCNHSSTGAWNVDYTAAGFSATPVCVASGKASGKMVNVLASSSTAATVRRDDDAGTDENGTWSLLCMGQ